MFLYHDIFSMGNFFYGKGGRERGLKRVNNGINVVMACVKTMGGTSYRNTTPTTPTV